MTMPADDRLALLPSEADIAHYEEHGWWISPKLLSAEEIDEAWFGAERYYSGERDAVLPFEAGTDWTEQRGNILRQNDYVSLQIEQLWTLVHHPMIAATAARLARTPSVRLFHDQLINKPPQVSHEVSTVGWHTDIAYWKTCSSREMISAWIPFQTVTADMGPMTVIDRSHRWHRNDRLEFFHEWDLDAITARIASDGAELVPVRLLMELGQVSFHHCRTIHGSLPNSSDRPRAALALHMQDATNRYVPTVDDHGNRQSHLNDFLCRTDESGNPDYTDPDVCPVLWEEPHE
ncbi:phytanoyl-CoA dioxygenase family protein [Nocardia sp. bgisy134]|uniref:phytanoyl-CoA dioxygenase family protein n=1 Tax=Nocardia sp. bgisy134 TaxID=3413789 RepID=UPI003D73465D